MNRNVKYSVSAIIVALLAVAGAYYVVANHSIIRKNLICKGNWKHDKSTAESIVFQLDEYRWWRRLWNHTDGTARTQTFKATLFLNIPNVDKTDDGQFASYKFHGFSDNPDFKIGKRVGTYSEASKAITLQFKSNRIFVGQCSE